MPAGVVAVLPLVQGGVPVGVRVVRADGTEQQVHVSSLPGGVNSAATAQSYLNEAVAADARGAPRSRAATLLGAPHAAVRVLDFARGQRVVAEVAVSDEPLDPDPWS